MNVSWKMRPTVARFGFQQPYFTTAPAAESFCCRGNALASLVALRCASRLAHWHWELWAPQQPQEGEPQTTSNQTDFLFLPKGDADVGRRPQRVNSQPNWLNGTAFLRQSHSMPSTSPGCSINKGGGFYIKSPLVTCRGSAVIHPAAP